MCYVLDKEVVAKVLLYGELMDGFLSSSPPPSINSWTQHMHYYYHTSDVVFNYFFVVLASCYCVVYVVT